MNNPVLMADPNGLSPRGGLDAEPPSLSFLNQLPSGQGEYYRNGLMDEVDQSVAEAHKGIMADFAQGWAESSSGYGDLQAVLAKTPQSGAAILTPDGNGAFNVTYANNVSTSFGTKNGEQGIWVDYGYGENDGSGGNLSTDVFVHHFIGGDFSSPSVTTDKFRFIDGPGNWQQAAVNNLTYKLITSWGVTSTLKIPTVLFFGLPKQIKGGETISKSLAANIATFAVNRGYMMMVQVWKGEPELSNVQLQKLWITNIQAIMALSGGTVGKTSARGYMSPIVDASPD